MKEIDLKRLRYFVAVAERLNFTEAARFLRMAQPPLSMQIRKLESELGGALFTRQKRRIALTPLGRITLDEARDLLTRSAASFEKIQSLAAGREGHLSVRYDSSALSERTTRRIRKFLRKHRGLHFSTEAVVGHPLDFSSSDGVFCQMATKDLPSEAIVLESGVIQIAVPLKHRLAERIECDPADLLGEPAFLAPVPQRSALEHTFAHILEQSGIFSEPVDAPANLQLRFWQVSLGRGITPCSSMDRATLDGVRIPLVHPDSLITHAFLPNPESRSGVLLDFMESIRG